MLVSVVCLNQWRKVERGVCVIAEKRENDVQDGFGV